MLRITIPAQEGWDEAKQEFVYTNEQKLILEHSLLSIAKWESRWKKPFLDKFKEKTYEESIDYIRCMTITQNVDPNCYYCITNEIMKQISDYIEDTMTATWFSKEQQRMRPGRLTHEVVTSELIYYWMVALQIPFECEKWHINRLLTLIQICNIKNEPPKKMSAAEITRRNAALNAARLKKYHTKG